MIYKNAFYEKEGKIYFINKITLDCDLEYRFQCNQAYPVSKTNNEMYYSFNHNSLSISKKQIEVYYDFFNNANCLNTNCFNCDYFKASEIEDILHIHLNDQDESIGYAVCILRKNLNSGDERYIKAAADGDFCYSELYVNCQFKTYYNSLNFNKTIKKWNYKLNIETAKNVTKKFFDFKKIDYNYFNESYFIKNFYRLKNSCLNPYQLEYLIHNTPSQSKIFFTDIFALFFILKQSQGETRMDIPEPCWCFSNEISVELYYQLYLSNYHSAFVENGKWFLVHSGRENMFVCGSSELIKNIKSLE